jgi:hypothetical protein
VIKKKDRRKKDEMTRREEPGRKKKGPEIYKGREEREGRRVVT